MATRPVKRLVKSKPTVEGAGVRLRRAFGFGATRPARGCQPTGSTGDGARRRRARDVARSSYVRGGGSGAALAVSAVWCS
jgi:hypothetical protein